MIARFFEEKNKREKAFAIPLSYSIEKGLGEPRTALCQPLLKCNQRNVLVDKVTDSIAPVGLEVKLELISKH